MSEVREREQAILDLLSRDWSKGPLVIEAETAVEIRTVIADNRALRRQVDHLRGVMAELSPVIQSLWDAAVKHVTPVLALVGPYLEPDAPMGAEWDVKVQSGYEDDPPPPEPSHGDRGTCAVCGGEIIYRQANDGTLWWAHVKTVADGHGARFGGPA